MELIKDWIKKHFFYSWEEVDSIMLSKNIDLSNRPVYTAFVHYLWPLFVLALFAIVMMGVALILSVAIALTEAVTYIRKRRK